MSRPMHTRPETVRLRVPSSRRRGWIGLQVLAVAGLAYVLALGPAGVPATAGEVELEEDEQGKFQAVSWSLLGSFPYDEKIPGLMDPASEEEIARRSQEIVPADVRALDGKRVALRGFMIPIRVERDRVLAFVLAAKNDLGCCFGSGLAMNQWVEVELAKGQEFPGDPYGFPTLGTVLGTLRVGEKVQEGYVLSLYGMVAEKVRKG